MFINFLKSLELKYMGCYYVNFRIDYKDCLGNQTFLNWKIINVSKSVTLKQIK